MFAQRARDNLACVAFCALVGGQDELVFDGHSFVVDHTGETIARAAQFREDLLVCDVDLRPPAPPACARPATRRARARAAPRRRVAVLAGRCPRRRRRATRSPAPGALARAARAGRGRGLRRARRSACTTTSRRTASQHVVLGLSGGIDSALVACLAVDALGAERVSAAIMPSRYSSSETQEDARALAAALGVRVARAADRAGRWTPTSDTLAPEFEGRDARPHRGEPAGAHPRQPADGAVEQVRLARARRPATSRRCRSATRRSTATSPAASP